MVRSPCHECGLKDQDKKNSVCEACSKREMYVASLGGPTESIPVELSDFGGNMKNKRWSEKEIDFLKDNCNEMTNIQMAQQLGRAIPALANKMSVMGIKRESVSRRGGVCRDNEPSETKLPPAGEVAGPCDKKSFFVLDFSEHGDLFDRFLSFAKENFRAPEHQALYLINKALQDYGHKSI